MAVPFQSRKVLVPFVSIGFVIGDFPAPARVCNACGKR